MFTKKWRAATSSWRRTSTCIPCRASAASRRGRGFCARTRGTCSACATRSRPPPGPPARGPPRPWPPPRLRALLMFTKKWSFSKVSDPSWSNTSFSIPSPVLPPVEWRGLPLGGTDNLCQRWSNRGFRIDIGDWRLNGDSKKAACLRFNLTGRRSRPHAPNILPGSLLGVLVGHSAR